MPESPGYERKVQTHHITILPDNIVTKQSYPMYTSNSTAGGYINSSVRAQMNNSSGSIWPVIEGIFNASHIFPKYIMASTGLESSKWVTSLVDLPTICMLYGSNVVGQSFYDGKIYQLGIEKRQLALAFLRQNTIFTGDSVGYWFQDIVDTTSYALFNASGFVGEAVASGTHPIRPVFGIKAN